MPDGNPLPMQRRWYDQEATCQRLLEQIKGMPQAEAREFSARVVIHFCEKIRKEVQKKDGMGLSSIGASAISNLYRFGQKKRRWYDQDAVLHKAVGMFYSLTPEALAVIGFKLGDTLGLIQVYCIVCDQLDQPADMREMAQICTTALHAGKKEAEEILVSIVGEDLYRSLSQFAAEN